MLLAHLGDNLILISELLSLIKVLLDGFRLAFELGLQLFNVVISVILLINLLLYLLLELLILVFLAIDPHLEQLPELRSLVLHHLSQSVSIDFIDDFSL